MSVVQKPQSLSSFSPLKSQNKIRKKFIILAYYKYKVNPIKGEVKMKTFRILLIAIAVVFCVAIFIKTTFAEDVKSINGVVKK